MLKPKKSLGQNFIRDKAILQRIIDALAPTPEEHLVEIGPGEGILTRMLAERAREVTCIELDRRAAELLRASMPRNVTVIEQDVLKFDLSHHAAARAGGEMPARVVVAGNIPYYISTPILFYLFDHARTIDRAALMFQKEVAERIVASPGGKTYGVLSLMAKIHTEAQLLWIIGRGSFFPVPSVDSALVLFKIKRQLPECDLSRLKRIIRAVFAQRRKTLRNGLKSAGYSKEQIERIAVDPLRRPEQLSLEEFIGITNALGAPGAVRTPEPGTESRR